MKDDNDKVKERLRLKHKITPDDVDGYLDIDTTKSTLDGLFASKELRRIADAMDEWSKENSKERKDSMKWEDAKIGDKVKVIKILSPQMIVISKLTTGPIMPDNKDKLLCCWFDTLNQYHEKLFPAEILQS